MIMYVSVEEGSPGTGSGGSANFYIFRNRFARTDANPWIPPLAMIIICNRVEETEISNYGGVKKC